MGIVFIYASYSKILNPVSFSSNIHNYGVTPIYIENILALVIPLVELFIGFGLITGVKYRASLDISIYLMFLFILLISQAYLRGKSIDCGCFMSEISLEDAFHGKKFPIDSDDWCWLYPEVKKELLNLYQDKTFVIVIFTNQQGLEKGKTTL